MRTFSVQTLGCKVNQYESEQLAALLRARGLRLVESGRDGDADLRIINTCSVTMQAAAKSRQLSRRAARTPSASSGQAPSTDSTNSPQASSGRAVVSLPQLASGGGPSPTASPIAPSNQADPQRSRLVVTGCWATSDRNAAEAIPGVDAVIGHNQDVALELIRLLDLWQGSGEGHSTHSSSQHAAPEPPGNEGWMNKVGSPAGRSTEPITLSYETEVNEKIGTAVLSSWSAPSVRPRGTVTLPLLSARQTGRQRAHLKIQDGCDAHCTYCIIPSLRPAVWSKPVADVVAEAKQLVAAGHVELILTGIFLGAYGHATALRRRRQSRNAPNTERPDPPQSPSSMLKLYPDDAQPLIPDHSPLAQLTDALCTSVPGLKRLRFSSLEPGDLNADLIAALRSHPQVVPHFHLPLQSGSNPLLRRMNRQYTREDYLAMVGRVRDAFDRPALTTDIIVGFPGESDAEFERTLEVARHCRFIHIHAFPFSPRPGTAAARWTRRFVPGTTVNQRIEALRVLSETDSLAYRRQFIGQAVQLLVEREKGDEVEAHPRTSSSLRHGRCERYFPVHFHDPTARPGDFVGIRIDRVEGERTFGSRVG